MKNISGVQGRIFRGEVIIIPMYHPTTALYHQNLKDDLRKSFAVLKEVLDEME